MSGLLALQVFALPVAPAAQLRFATGTSQPCADTGFSDIRTTMIGKRSDAEGEARSVAMIRIHWLPTASLAILLAVFASAPSPAEAICPYPATYSSVNDPYQFVSAGIESFGWANQAGSRVNKDGLDLVSLLIELKQTRGDYECAAAKVIEFVTSTDEDINKNAQALHTIYKELIVLYDRSVSQLIQSLDDINKGNHSPGRMADRLSDIVVSKDEWLRMMLGVAANSTYALVEWSKEGKTTGRLRITESQRQALMKRIESTFTLATVRDGPKAGQGFAEGAAAGVYKFLANRKWRSTDTR
jgi:hypothetical protein